jgi:hypothetical protein
MQNDDDKRNNQKDVNESTGNMSKQADEPQYYQYSSNR